MRRHFDGVPANERRGGRTGSARGPAAGRRLGIAEKTDKAHVTQIFQTIGVTDRTQAALWADRQGRASGLHERRERLRGEQT